MSTKAKIIGYLLGRGWISGSELEYMAKEWETKASVIARRARELANEGRIDRRIGERGTVQYKQYIPKVADYVKKLEAERQVHLI